MNGTTILSKLNYGTTYKFWNCRMWVIWIFVFVLRKKVQNKFVTREKNNVNNVFFSRLHTARRVDDVRPLDAFFVRDFLFFSLTMLGTPGEHHHGITKTSCCDVVQLVVLNHITCTLLSLCTIM